MSKSVMGCFINDIKNDLYKTKTCPNCNHTLTNTVNMHNNTISCKNDCGFGTFFGVNLNYIDFQYKKYKINICINVYISTPMIYINDVDICDFIFIKDNLNLKLINKFPYINKNIIKYFENIIFE